MTITERTHVPRPNLDGCPPPLENGDRLSRAEFERRYHGMPELKKAELIEGEVYVGSPVSPRKHGKPHARIMAWLGYYEAYTPGIECFDNSTVVLDLDNEFQPDAFVFIDTAAGGGAQFGEDEFVHGPPELVVEIAASSVSIDLNKKLNVYRRNGVKEYVVWRVQDEAIDWLVLRDGVYVPLAADSEGVVRSEALPGLTLDVPGMLAGNMQKVFNLQLNEIGRSAHQAFIEKLTTSTG